VPALPPEARTIRETTAAPGCVRWVMLTIVSVGAAVAFAKTRPAATPTDELIVVSMCVGRRHGLCAGRDQQSLQSSACFRAWPNA
jgi:hypothetical protein